MTSAFQRLLDQVGTTQLPPVHLWNPTKEGDIDIRIREDGIWYHEGTEIKRKSIARVFSSILVKQNETYYLKTPQEKLRIQVDDAPFIAVDYEVEGTSRDQRLIFRTNFDDVVLVDEEHQIFIRYYDDTLRPYVHVRAGLNALIARSAFYRMIDEVCEMELDEIVVWSCGTRFNLGRA